MSSVLQQLNYGLFKHFIVASCFVVILPLTIEAATPRKTNSEGIKQYKNEQYDHAVAEFMDALEKAPDRSELHYNLGTALHKLDNNEEAVRSLSRALSEENSSTSADAWYNLGNSLARAQKFDDALQAYKNSLMLRHNDQDAKHNLETVLKLMQMQQQQQQQQQKNSDQSENQEEQQQQQQQAQQQPEQNEEQQEAQSAEKQENNEEEQNQSELENLDDQMTPEEALQLLQAMEDDEQEAQKEKLKRQFGEPKRVEKDW